MNQNDTNRRKQFKDLQIQEKKESFERWLEMPMTSMCISFIPPSPDHPEALKMLLKAAFEDGFHNGMAVMAGEFAATILISRTKRDDNA